MGQPPQETRPPTHYRSPLKAGPTQVQRHAPPGRQQTLVSAPPPQPASPQPKPKRGRWLARTIVTLSLFLVIASAVVLAAGAIGYFWIAWQLPPAETLQSRSFQFATSEILDREGNLLWEIIDPTGGRRTVVTLDQVSLDLIDATIATEDRFFYQNVGVDPIAIVRAIYYNVTEGSIVSGASTITQQLARNVLLTPEERAEQSLTRKVKEAVLAVEINRQYSKDEILQTYLNQIYYGNFAYGIEAAAQTYFGKSAIDLTLPEAAFLAGLPQAPALHDPYTNPEGAKARQINVLSLMVEAGYITHAEAEAAAIAPLNFQEVNFAIQAPHFVTYVRQELERNFGPDYLYKVGLQVRTTLDPRLQAIAEEEVQAQVNALAGQNVSGGALVAIDVGTGEILAMVGSPDFQNETASGQVNMAITPRQPGSSIKPLTYLAAFERLNYTPGTLIMDTPVEYPDGAGGVYRPENFDEKYHGPILLRYALANSYNIPPVKTLSLMGVEALKEMAARLGITTLTRNDYGLALTLGSGEVSVLEMTGAYQAIANQGVLVPPTSIIDMTDTYGQVIQPTRPQPSRVLREEHAYLITHILADNEARTPAFGPNSYLRLSRPAAAKTGTTNDYRDSWAMGYTPDLVTGVWVGNPDNTAMNSIGGISGAGPIWYNFMEQAHQSLPIRDFVRPPTIVELEICADSGTIPSEVCPQRRQEVFFQDQPPLGPEHDIHQLVEIDRNTGLLANEFCRANVERRYYRVYPPDGREWAISQGIEQPPTDYCPSANIVAAITSPLDGSTARGILTLEGSAAAANFSHYQVELGLGTNPGAFTVIHGPINQTIEQGVLGAFDTTQVENGPYTLRLVVFDQTGGAYDARVRLLVDNAPTPTFTATATETPSPTVTPTATETVTETPTPTLTLEPATPTPTTPPSPTATPTTPVDVPTSTPTLPLEVPTATDTPSPTSTTEADANAAATVTAEP